MAVRAVIDTNIWVSSLLNPFGFPAIVRKSFEEGAFQVVISEPILEELAEVLNRPRIKDKYGISENDISELLVLIEERSEPVLLSSDISICRDKDDNFIIETAIKGKAAFLVTRDDDIKFDKSVSSFLLPYGVSVISITRFLAIIKP
ncbi:MAG: putative toxin-antitoxin system toxin component, PIN family [Planctomycetes bacterium RIFCSPHIGHO2_12_39_6]|nr:MAG: putative toxin-antitoxin system toxin component, PIN family [Planctomycetes bacterium RIFCSPHIGHO2_12_39_6]